MQLRPSHIWMVATYSMRYSLRSGGGLMFMMVLLIAGLSVASIFVSQLEQMLLKVGGDIGAGELARQITEMDAVRDAVTWITGGDPAQTEFLLYARPALVSAIALVLLIVVPYTTCLGAFNQTAGDIGSRGLRFLLLRTERHNVFFGRFLGALLFNFIWTTGLVAVIAVFIHLKFKIYPLGTLAAWSTACLFALLLLSLPYVALCAWVSGSLSSAFGSLAMCMVLCGFSILLLLMLKGTLVQRTPLRADDLAWMMRLIPWGWKYDTLHPSLATRSLAVAVQLGFTALFLFGGARAFQRRDL